MDWIGLDWIENLSRQGFKTRLHTAAVTLNRNKTVAVEWMGGCRVLAQCRFKEEAILAYTVHSSLLFIAAKLQLFLLLAEPCTDEAGHMCSLAYLAGCISWTCVQVIIMCLCKRFFCARQAWFAVLKQIWVLLVSNSGC